MAKYQQYKDSGFEWLGEVPSHWKVCRLKHVKANKPNAFVDGPFGSNLKSIHFVDDGDVYVIESNFATTGIINEDNLKTITSNHFQTISRSEAEVGDIIIAKIGARFGMSSILPKLTKKSVVSGNSLKLTINSKVCNTEYVHYLLQHSKSESAMDDGVNVTAQPALSLGGLNNLPFLLPSSEEQDNITKFLSYETAQIDTLIEKQQTLIQLLKEKRQAVISHAVTKGLNPDAPMKDSGVEWLGEVPEHWEVTKAKYVSDIFIPQRNKPELNAIEGCPWVTMEDMRSQYIDEVHRYVKSEAMQESGSKVLKAGAVIASCVGNFGVTSINRVDVIINQQLQAFQPKRIKPEYLQAIVALSKSYFELIGTAATLIYVNREGFENLPVIVPTTQEQEAISKFINIKSKQFDLLVSRAEQAIQLMQERRTALISAAVTGKIDVRGWRASE